MKWKNYIWALCYFILILLSFSVQLADAQQVTRPKKSLLPYHDFYKIRSGLPHFYHKIKNHRPVTVAFLGGSITYNPGWRNKICKYFRKHFPHEKFHFIDAGIPSLGSLPNAFRLQHDVLNKGKISLMFVEAAVNDRVNGTDSLTQIRDLEGIVRHAKRGNPNMDMIFMSFADTVKLNDYGAGRIPMAVHNHELVARHYGLPSINLAKEVYEKINAGEFSWKYDFKNLHPSPFGERLYFKSIKALLNACFKRSDSSGGAIPKYHMPDKMNKYSFGRGEYYPIQKAQLGKGWQLVNNWYPPSSDQVHTRKRFTHVPVIEASVPGSELKFPFTGSAIGFSVLAGPDAGTIEYSIDGKPFKKMNLYTRWSANLYLPWYELFAGDLKNGHHVLRLRIAKTKDPKSKGHACKIVYFLVNKE